MSEDSLTPCVVPDSKPSPSGHARLERNRLEAESHPFWTVLPEQAMQADWDDATECCCHESTTYPSASFEDVPAWNEACRVLLERWPWPLHIDFSLINISPTPRPQWMTVWQIVGDDARLVERIIKRWVEVTRNLDPGHPDLDALVVPEMPDAPAPIIHSLLEAFRARKRTKLISVKIHPRHVRLHEVADRGEGWTCGYCSAELIDICSDEDMEFDDAGGRFVSPSSLKRLPTLDHLVPQVSGGSNRIENLILACRQCNSRKGAA